MVARVFFSLGMLLFLSGCAHSSKVVDDDPIVGRWVYQPSESATGPGSLGFHRNGTWKGTGQFQGEGSWQRYWPPIYPSNASEKSDNSIDALLSGAVHVGTGASNPPFVNGQVMRPKPMSELDFGENRSKPLRGDKSGIINWSSFSIRPEPLTETRVYSLRYIPVIHLPSSNPEFYLVNGRELIVTFSDGGQIVLKRETRRSR